MLFSIPGVENLSQTTVTIVALVLALVLVAFFGLILRRLTGGRLSLKTDRGRARQPRLGIVDVYDLDRQRQLILLRRDNVEHLLLVGGPNDVVVETNIVRAGGSRLPATPVDVQDRAEPAAERGVEIAPVRPVLEPLGMRSAEPVAARLGAADTMARGAIEPALKPSSVSAAHGPRPTDRGASPSGGPALSREPLAETSRAQTGAGMPGAGMPGVGQPIPRATSRTAEAGRPDMAKQLEEALARPASDPRPAPARTLELPRATPVAQPGRSMSIFRKTDPIPLPNGRTEPSSSPTPARTAEPSPTPATVPELVEGRVEADDGAAGQEPARYEPAREEPARDEPVRQQPGRDEAEGGQDVRPETVGPEPVGADRPEETVSDLGDPTSSPPAVAEAQVRPVPRPLPAAKGLAPEPSAAPATPIVTSPSQAASAASSARNDPFSIEDIEAEFARLLGRPVDKRDDRT